MIAGVDSMKLQCRGRVLDLTQTRVMGVVNVTPDSFYDGGKTAMFDAAIAQAERMLESGAEIIDIGGESTRPGGLASISASEEADRVAAVVEYVSHRFGVLVSVDTSNPAVMEIAVQAGASIINDVRALQRPGALAMAAACDVPVILMHSLVEQPKDGFVPEYSDIITAVKTYLMERVAACEVAGIAKKRIILDPGFGGGMFGKTARHDLQLLKRFEELHTLKIPLLAGVSRKSFIGAVLEKNADERLFGSLAAATLLAFAGAHIIRVHDVAETVDVVKVVKAVKSAA